MWWISAQGIKSAHTPCNIWCGFKDLTTHGKISTFDTKEKVRYMYLRRDMFIASFFTQLKDFVQFSARLFEWWNCTNSAVRNILWNPASCTHILESIHTYYMCISLSNGELKSSKVHTQCLFYVDNVIM